MGYMLSGAKPLNARHGGGNASTKLNLNVPFLFLLLSAAP